MKRRLTALVALVLAAALLLGGCRNVNDVLDRYYAMLQMGTATAFEDMEYVRPDMTTFRKTLEETMVQVETQTDVDKLMESVYEMYWIYYDFATHYSLAQIHYFLDMTDVYWEKEYNWCMDLNKFCTKYTKKHENFLTIQREFALEADSPFCYN